MTKLKGLKKWGWLPIVLLLIVVAAISMITHVVGSTEESLFNLNEREIVLAVDEYKKVELESEEVNVKTAKLTVSWRSSKSSVASVDKDGTIKAASGGETKITAVVNYKGKEYSTSCVVTVKAEGNTYSTYKIRWFTQKQDRSEYEIKEETFEREVGSVVELTELDAKKNLSKQYVLNKEKSRLRGTVKSRLGVCVLEVYFDVAEVPYTVDYYYESADQLGTYTEKETKNYRAYAFTEVKVTDAPKSGFVRNDKVKASVLSNSSVTAGTKLKVYCDRIRSNVTVNYISGRASAIYTNVYGVGLINAPADALMDSVEYYTTTYVNGKKKNATMNLLKGMKKDTTVDFRLDGVGFTYSTKNGVSTIMNECSEKATPCYAMLKGKSNVLYLSATYQITGSTSNKFGISLSDGTTSRQIRFKIAASRKSAGVAIQMDNTTKGGLLTEKDTTNTYDYTCEYDNEVFVWAANYNTGAGTDSSMIKDMLIDKDGGDYQIQWAVWEGVLYARIEDQTVLRLPLSRLNPKWNEKTKFQIGISSYDATAWNDELRVTNVNLKTGNAAKEMLVLDGQVTSLKRHKMGYDVISGSYIPASYRGVAYLYGKEAVNTGISADVKWIEVNNTTSAVGISVKMGDKSVQYVIEGMNIRIRRHEGETWGTPVQLTAQILAEVTPFNEQGKAKIDAFVKDGYLYVLYNGVEAQCVNMLSLFPEYTADKKVSVGIYSWDAWNGLATFSNVTELNEEAIAQVCKKNSVKEWGYYVEPATTYASNVTYNFGEESAVVERNTATDRTKTGVLTFMGENTAWQVEGKFNRPDPNEKSNIYLGFRITSGDKKTLIFGRQNGFQQNWSKSGELAYREYSDFAPSVYAFNNIVSTKFFHGNNTERVQNTLGFKAVIYNDTFYVWFTDEDGNTGLCWRIPLTEEQFGNFETGSSYQIAVVFGGDSLAHATTTDLSVKMGYQVTGQTNFTTDHSGQSYPFEAAVAKIEENIATYANKDGSYFRTHNIGGNLAENTLNHSWAMNYDENGKPKFDGTNMEYDALENKLTIIDPARGSNTSAYFNAADEKQVISGTIRLESTTGPAYGITVRANGQSAQIVANASGGFRIQLNEKWSNFSVTAEAKKAVPTWSNPYTDQELKVMAIVDQGALYLFFDDKMIGSVDLYQLLPGYVEGDMVQLGIYGWAVNGAPASEIKDLTQAVGEDMAVYMTANHITLTDQYAWRIFRNGDEFNRQGFNLTNMTYGNDVYTTDKVSTMSYMYNRATTMEQKMEATVKLADLNLTNNCSYGFTVKSGTANAQILIKADDGKVRITKGHAWNVIKDFATGIDGISKYKNTGSFKMTVMIKEDNLYVFIDNHLGRIPLTDILAGYKSGDAVALGVCGWLSKNGPATFSNVFFTAGSKAISDEMEAKFDTAKDWNIK